MNLFELSKFKVSFSPQALALKPFKAIWDADTSKTKDNAVKEMALVYFLCDVQSDYISIRDEGTRLKQLILDLELPKGYKKPKYITEACKFYEERSKTVVSSLYKASLNSIDVITDELNNTKTLLDESNDRIIAMEKLTKLHTTIPTVMAKLEEAAAKVIKHQKQSSEDDSNMYEEFLPSC
jgi:hypothetical protein